MADNLEAIVGKTISRVSKTDRIIELFFTDGTTVDMMLMIEGDNDYHHIEVSVVCVAE